jgi:hypothetical protein
MTTGVTLPVEAGALVKRRTSKPAQERKHL